MQFTDTGEVYIVKIEPDEQVIATITQFCVDHDIANASFTGIGAIKELSCGYYELIEKAYHFSQYKEMLEVLSLTGNVMLKEGKPFVHMHGVFSGTDNNAFGGHVEEMTVGVTLEVILKKYSTSVERQHDEEIGLFLINCGE